jgi:23S rRNA (cytidine2498-2'-O)-methyltransferase
VHNDSRPGYVVVAHCRAGFETEVTLDLRRLVKHANAALDPADVDAPRGRGFVVARLHELVPRQWQRAFLHAPPVFARSIFGGLGPHSLLDPDARAHRPDRIAPLVALIEGLRAEPWLVKASAFESLRLETPDTNEGKKLSVLARALERRLAAELQARGALANEAPTAALAPAQRPNLHVLFADGAHVFVGASFAPWASPWPMGIPRLKMPRGAPSRSALKLAEAIATFVGERERELLRAGMRAVDLGAAPGGWSWQLAHRGLRVTAIDNGPLKGEVRDDPLVTHLTTDGLKWRPSRAVDWMVCDIVERPSRIAQLVAQWIAEGGARRSIFNLKLPMKKRYEEVERCVAIIGDHLAKHRVRHCLVLRQLYHDRAEVTGFIERVD